MEQSKNPEDTRNRIKNLLRIRGPSLPVHISRETGINTIFAGAFLSELASEKEIKISDLKVGGSPLYFLQGQEFRLEAFYNYLPPKEKEAFLLLKQKKILEDRKLEPAIRVALRNIKDFAIPLAIDKGQGQELFWRFYSLTEQEAREKIKPEIVLETKEKLKPKITEQAAEKIKLETKPEIKKELKPKIKPVAEQKKLIKHPEEKPLLEIKPVKEIEKEVKPIKEKEKPEFTKQIISLLNSGNIEIIEEKELKKKEFLGIIRVNSELGKLKFLCVAKDKKRISENDFSLALQKSQSLRLPVLFLSQGELDKKALSFLEQSSGLIKFKRITE